MFSTVAISPLVVPLAAPVILLLFMLIVFSIKIGVVVFVLPLMLLDRITPVSTDCADTISFEPMFNVPVIVPPASGKKLPGLDGSCALGTLPPASSVATPNGCPFSVLGIKFDMSAWLACSVSMSFLFLFTCWGSDKNLVVS